MIKNSSSDENPVGDVGLFSDWPLERKLLGLLLHLHRHVAEEQAGQDEALWIDATVERFSAAAEAALTTFKADREPHGNNS